MKTLFTLDLMRRVRPVACLAKETEKNKYMNSEKNEIGFKALK